MHVLLGLILEGLEISRKDMASSINDGGDLRHREGLGGGKESARKANSATLRRKVP
ncbi:hypothetical protein GCM10007338_03020 [Corynebacterium pelargi]|nr:hypothetical protein GCM10007338_03020 [Corynebacterium pelargi]